METQDGLNTQADSVIRYSREFLMACAESPLVQRPEALPPTSEWFGYVDRPCVEDSLSLTNKCQLPIGVSDVQVTDLSSLALS